MKACIYTRTSAEEKNNIRDSNRTQEEICRQEAKKRNYEVIEVYSDIGKSGGSFRRRKQLKKLKEDAKNKLFDFIYILEFSRLSRRLIDQELFVEEMNNLGIKVISCDGTQEDEIRQMQGVMNQYQRKFFQKRVEVEHQSRLKQKKPVSRPPFGYKIEKKTRKWIVSNKEAKIVKRAFELRMQKKEIKEIASELNFIPATIKYMLSNISYCGFIKYRDQLIGSHKQIISRAVFEKCQI